MKLPGENTVKAAGEVRQQRRRNYENHPNCVELFAGAGGLAEGFRQAGWEILAAADHDASAAETFKVNFTGTAFYTEDISKLSPARLLKEVGLSAGELDCLIGGPPCQSFSYNNHARSASSKGAKLVRRYLRIVETFRPKTLVMENVPGMLTIGDGRIVSDIQKKLVKLGYEVGIRILYAEDFGVPQERRRVFIVATRLGWEDSLIPNGTHGPAEKPSESANGYVHRWRPRNGTRPKSLVTVGDAIGDLPSVPNGGGSALTEYAKKPTVEFQRQARSGSRTLYNHVTRNLSTRMLRRIEIIPEGGNWRDIPRRLLPAGMKRAQKTDHTKRYGRLARTGLCCTILTKCDPHWGSYIHPLQNRTITVREAARLQTFPDKFRFCGNLTSQYQQIGNAVPPAMARKIAQALKRHLRRKA